MTYMKRSLICLFILEIFIYWGSIENAFSQADAGDDKFFIKGDPAGTIIGGANDNPLWCYSWEPKTGLSDPRSPCPTATPDSTTTYKLKVVGTDFSFTSEDEMTVYVLEKLKLRVENNITECMEKREVTFTAIILGNLPAKLTDEIEYIFHYKKANGIDFTENELSSKTIQDNTVETDTVLPGDSDHKFKTSVYAEAKYKNGTLISDTVNIDVYELWIKYFRYFYDLTKEWKVVVGFYIDYSATASSDCKNWSWKMEDGVPDKWHLEGGNEQTGHYMWIPFTDLAEAKNSDFGDAYGTITVSCEDEEGNKYTFNSTELNQPRKVQVFFDPDRNLEGLSPSTEKPPCWFVFWKDGKVVEDMDMDICVYRNDVAFGAWNAKQKLLKLGPLACTNGDPEGDGPDMLTDMEGHVFYITGTGKHLECVAETITHELYHKVVSDSMYYVIPQSDSDSLPDLEEMHPNRWYFKKSNPDNPDTYHFVENFGWPDYAEYADQEVRCRIIELTPYVKKTFPDLDWSKDIENPKWQK